MKKLFSKAGLYLGLGLIGASASALTLAGTHKFSGSVEAELQFFPNEGSLDEQKDVFGSLAIRPEYYWRSENKNHKVKTKLFYRATEPNGSRTHGDVREFNYRFSRGGWYLTAGVDTVFWGVTESAHLVDIINQTDNLDSISGEEKLGQPMIAVGIEKDFGNIDAYVLPYFRTREFPSGPERYQIALGDQTPEIDSDANFYESDDEENNIDFALRWYKSFDQFDLGLSYFNGTSRDPLPVILNLLESFGQDDNGKPTLNVDSIGSFYEQKQQLGLEFQYLYDDWIIKLEAAHQVMDSGDYSEAAFGFEYTFSDMSPWGQDVGILIEYLWNDREQVNLLPYTFEANSELSDDDRQFITDIANGSDESPSVEGYYLSPMQNDLFIGARFSLNDIAGTEFLAGVIYDLDDDTTSVSFEGSTRIGDSLRLTANVYFFNQVFEDNPFKPIENDDLIELKAEYFF